MWSWRSSRLRHVLIASFWCEECATRCAATCVEFTVTRCFDRRVDASKHNTQECATGTLQKEFGPCVFCKRSPFHRIWDYGMEKQSSVLPLDVWWIARYAIKPLIGYYGFGSDSLIHNLKQQRRSLRNVEGMRMECKDVWREVQGPNSTRGPHADFSDY